MDEFSVIRIVRLIDGFKKTHGRDISEAELAKEGVLGPDISHLVTKGALDKYQVTNGEGSLVNRFKVHKDWRSLNS